MKVWRLGLTYPFFFLVRDTLRLHYDTSDRCLYLLWLHLDTSDRYSIPWWLHVMVALYGLVEGHGAVHVVGVVTQYVDGQCQHITGYIRVYPCVVEVGPQEDLEGIVGCG